MTIHDHQPNGGLASGRATFEAQIERSLKLADPFRTGGRFPGEADLLPSGQRCELLAIHPCTAIACPFHLTARRRNR